MIGLDSCPARALRCIAPLALACSIGAASAGCWHDLELPENGGSLGGQVLISGGVRGARISVDQLDLQTGEVRFHVGEAVTDATGHFVIETGTENGIFRITARSGTFEDLATGATIQLDNTDEIVSLIATGSTRFPVGIFSDVVAGLASTEGIYDVEFRATDRLGRTTTVSRCFDLHLRVPPLEFERASTIPPAFWPTGPAMSTSPTRTTPSSARSQPRGPPPRSRGWQGGPESSSARHPDWRFPGVWRSSVIPSSSATPAPSSCSATALDSNRAPQARRRHARARRWRDRGRRSPRSGTHAARPRSKQKQCRGLDPGARH
jgi:hypothetical protein